MNATKRHDTKHLGSALFAACLGVLALGVTGNAAALELEPKARLHLDYGTQDADVEPLGSGWIVRRAAIGLEGQFNDDWSFEIGYGMADNGEFRPGDGQYRDVTLGYEGWSAGDITVGQFRIPFGLERLISSNDISFIERALPVDAFAPSRRMGIGFSRKRDAYTVSTMAFGSSIGGDDRGRGAAARLTVTPIHSAGTVVHLGIAAFTEKPRSKVDFDNKPESRVADVDLVNTGRIDDVSRINRTGLESAWRTGPFSLQGEWMQTTIRRNAGTPDANLDGWYVGGSWVLTSEARPYKNGEFKGIRPLGPGGAWELAARYSRINLDDGDVRGGKERNITVGLNYYLNEHLRIMFNYIQVHSQRRGQADNPRIGLLRAQLVF